MPNERSVALIQARGLQLLGPPVPSWGGGSGGLSRRFTADYGARSGRPSRVATTRWGLGGDGRAHHLGAAAEDVAAARSVLRDLGLREGGDYRLRGDDVELLDSGVRRVVEHVRRLQRARDAFGAMASDAIQRVQVGQGTPADDAVQAAAGRRAVELDGAAAKLVEAFQLRGKVQGLGAAPALLLPLAGLATLAFAGTIVGWFLRGDQRASARADAWAQAERIAREITENDALPASDPRRWTAEARADRAQARDSARSQAEVIAEAMGGSATDAIKTLGRYAVYAALAYGGWALYTSRAGQRAVAAGGAAVGRLRIEAAEGRRRTAQRERAGRHRSELEARKREAELAAQKREAARGISIRTIAKARRLRREPRGLIAAREVGE